MATKTSGVPETALYYFDTIVLSNFALSGRFDLLIDRYGPRAQITPEVLDEVSDGIVAGHRELKQIEAAVEKGACSAAPPLSIAERTIYRELLGTLGSGEASCITCAQCRGGLVVTDDRAARNCCSERGVLFTGTIGILKICCREGILAPREADVLLQNMINTGYFSPVDQISGLL